MSSSNPRSVEAKITRLTRQIAEIDEFFYRGNENEDRFLYAGMLERKRDDIVRHVRARVEAYLQPNSGSERRLYRKL
jgi:hypothetical protein